MRVLGNDPHSNWPLIQQLVSDLRKRIAEISAGSTLPLAPANLRGSSIVLLIVPDQIAARRGDDPVWREIFHNLTQNKPVAIILLDDQPIPADRRAISRVDALDYAAVYLMPLSDWIDQTPAMELVRFDEADEETQVVQPLGQAALLKAVTLLEAGEYDPAIRLLQNLRDSGYKPQFFSIEGILVQARKRRQQAALDAYREIATLAKSRVTWQTAREAWIAFLAKYPDFSDDRDHLADKLKYQAPSMTVEPGEGAQLAVPDPLRWIADLASPLPDHAEPGSTALSLPGFGDESSETEEQETMPDSLRWLADLARPPDDPKAAH